MSRHRRCKRSTGVPTEAEAETERAKMVAEIRQGHTPSLGNRWAVLDDMPGSTRGEAVGSEVGQDGVAPPVVTPMT